MKPGVEGTLPPVSIFPAPVLRWVMVPPPDPAVVERAVAEAIQETGAASPKDMGRVMKAAMAKLAGQSVDGKAVNELVRQKLSPA